MKLPIQAKPITRKVSTVRISADGITPSQLCSQSNPCPSGFRCTADGNCKKFGVVSLAVEVPIDSYV